MLKRLFGGQSTPLRLHDAAGIADFMATRAAFVSQRATTEYCRARSGIAWAKLMLETAFLERLEVCRWIGFGATAQEIGLLIDGRLRSHAPMAFAERGFLVDCLAAALRRYPEPASFARGWQGEIDDFAERLDAASLAAPKPAQDLGVVAARRIFDSLPIHASLRSHDEEMVRNHMRFAMVNVAAELDAALDHEALGRAIAARATC